MPTPDEIHLKTFPVTLRGFDQTEVTRFLQDVAAQLQSTVDRAEALESGAVLEAANRAAAEVAADARAAAATTIAEADELLAMAETEAVAVKQRAEAERKAIIAEAAAEAAELRAEAERIRDEASRIRADALGLSERELKQAADDSDEVRLKAVAEIESILARADAEVSAMLRTFRDSRDDLPGIGRHLTAPRNTRRGSQRQLGQ